MSRAARPAPQSRPLATAGRRRRTAVPDLADVLAPAWGWRTRGAGRLAHAGIAPEYQATTVQACGPFPFVAGSGAPSVGVPFGRHMMWGEVVCLDPFAWLEAGLVTNRGLTLLGQPGTGKSAALKRLARGLMAYGVRPLFLGDLKPDCSAVVAAAGGWTGSTRWTPGRWAPR